MIHDLNPEEFDSMVLQSKIPVLVDFYTTTCPPCRAMMPILEELHEEIGDSIQFTKFNATKDFNLAAQYKVSSVPSFLIFHSGSIAARRVGQAPKKEMKEWIHGTIQNTQ